MKTSDDAHGAHAQSASPQPEWTPAVGYVAGGREELQRHSAAIEEACRARRWELTELVKDGGDPDVRPFQRPGLAYALQLLVAGAAPRLVVSRLDQLSRGVVDLRALLEWFDSHGVALVALDVGLDTGTPHGRLAARVLQSVGGLERQRLIERTRRGLAAARLRGQSSGRPAVSDRPELVEQIRAMREAGMTLQAIADRLNEEGIPTARGGSKWRPSSVQSALGYRRTPAMNALQYRGGPIPSGDQDEDSE
jgi:DNA invertase Pin-like site-specific DNA recombinase